MLPLMGMMGTFESWPGAVCGAPPISLLTVWQYRDARQQLPFRFPLQIEVQSSAMGRFWPGDDGSIGPHLEMMTGGEASQRANKLR